MRPTVHSLQWIFFVLFHSYHLMEVENFNFRMELKCIIQLQGDLMLIYGSIKRPWILFQVLLLVGKIGRS